VIDLLRAAEDDPATLPAADAGLAMLPSLTYRRVLASFAATLPGGRP
jgi:hypothetical protein